MSKRWLCLLAILYPFLVPAQQPAKTVERISKVEIDDDETYSPKLEHPAYAEGGPVVLLDEAHGNSHFDKAFVKLISTDGYRVVVSRESFKYEELSKAKVLVIMNPGLFMPMSWHQSPQPLFTDVEAAAVKDWIAAGGSLFFASGSRKAESGQVLLSHLGIEFSQDILADHELLPSADVTMASGPQLSYTREKQMFSTHSIMGGRTESERVDVVTVDNANPLMKTPDNAVTLLHCSEKAMIIPRDWLSKKQELEAQSALLKSKGETESQPITMQSLSTPAARVPVAVAFKLGKGRVVVMGNSSALSSVLRQAVLEGKPISHKIGLGDGDNQKFTLNIMHWLSGVLE